MMMLVVVVVLMIILLLMISSCKGKEKVSYIYSIYPGRAFFPG